MPAFPYRNCHRHYYSQRASDYLESRCSRWNTGPDKYLYDACSGRVAIEYSNRFEQLSQQSGRHVACRNQHNQFHAGHSFLRNTPRAGNEHGTQSHWWRGWSWSLHGFESRLRDSLCRASFSFNHVWIFERFNESRGQQYEWHFCRRPGEHYSRQSSFCKHRQR